MRIFIIFKIFSKIFKKVLKCFLNGCKLYTYKGYKENKNMKKLEQIKHDLLKEKSQVEEDIAYYREMRDNTEDVSTREMYEHSLEYARGRWYGLEQSLSIIESYK